MSSPDSNSRDESREAESSGRTGSDPIEVLVTNAQLLQALTTVADSVNTQRGSTEDRDAQIAERLANLERVQQEQTRLLRDALTRPSGPTPAAEEVPRQVLEMERAMLWSLEVGLDGNQARRLPRPSIIGRALYDLRQEMSTGYEGSTPADIYLKISAQGPHHLSPTATNYVTRYAAGDTSAMSGKIGLHLEPRFKVLSDPSRSLHYADSYRQSRDLTRRGCRLFQGWPNWEARDDDPTGDGPSPSGSPAPAPAGGTGTT